MTVRYLCTGFNPLGENYIIRRDIYKDNTSKWSVNGRNATQRNVEVTVNKLNIQVGNLCQFLPQDKVTDFARMTQQELLENTEKAVGPADMFEKHQKLKNARDKERDLELSLTRITQKLEREQVLNARLEQDVKNYQEREKHIKIIDQLKLKRPWVLYEEKRKEHLAAKELKQSLVSKLQQARSLNAPLMKKLENAGKHIKEVDTKIKSLAEKVKEQANFATDCHQKLEGESDQIQELQDELMTKRQEEMTRKKPLQTELREVLDIGNRRLEQLRRMHKDTYDAVQWLRANQQRFQGTIYEPMMLLLNVKDPNKAKYLESTVSMNDMKAFVCENSEDMKLFLEIVRGQQKLKVNVIVAPTEASNTFQPNQPIAQLKQYGFQMYLRELFVCPEAVMRYLCKNYHVHKIPVGTDYTKLHVDNVIKANPNLQTFYTENHKKELTSKKNQRRQLVQKINLKKDTIKRVESEAVDLEQEEKATKLKISKYLSKKCKLLTDLKTYTQNCLKLSEERVRQSFLYTSLHSEQQNLEEQIREQSGTLKTVESELEKQKALVQRLHVTATSLLDAAKKAVNLDKNPDLEKIFDSLPSTLEAIDAAIHEEQARADCTFQTDYSIVQEYNEREKLIKELQKNWTDRKQELTLQREDTENVKREWLTPLQKLISKINKNFSYLFTCMKCAGEVDLNIPENPEDYEKYGIRIKVLFRDSEQLCELTPHHQSGGERSVSTVLYMMALQELTSVPFRCVDEINQLLQDLHYTDNVTILCVFNGEHLVNHTEFKVSKFLRRQRRLEQ
ncbi:hypothetical protein LSH36_73g01022 [Paralvinella palmiformis]|uniref:Structural maintenance of chromosomes protein 5 n=1 Tax=Paralvinella palmiformis TaxID=53620 RepID=A0AAD9K3G3_9ANNE|nr:hypothetical protein LSH36_73g01022 [Paralvinella palmiformis]